MTHESFQRTFSPPPRPHSLPTQGRHAAAGPDLGLSGVRVAHLTAKRCAPKNSDSRREFVAASQACVPHPSCPEERRVRGEAFPPSWHPPTTTKQNLPASWRPLQPPLKTCH